ncbi:DUF2752 domain-containing protein [Flavobacterium saccharophilum]|uniref:DUF2752 domain-containing protein n=1 Tax=Flavobacterium saccharophilum TaxID=29534 RepID=A0A1M7E8B0_9FLAO|nr:DUF2752 domain-containing protein [Flavobacterium saccharophilum]SHL88002.1 Protein of unknown function [Flavobacterium saccharophilum]
MLPCLFKTLFGIECLGCGFQRSVFLLFKGEFSAAFKMYPALYSTLLFFVFLFFYFLNKSQTRKKMAWNMAILNLVFMLGGYYYKHFYLYFL